MGTALALIELAAVTLEKLPEPTTALASGQRELFRYLWAANVALASLVGMQVGDSSEKPARSSALGDGQWAYGWSDEETARHFEALLEDWRWR